MEKRNKKKDKIKKNKGFPYRKKNIIVPKNYPKCKECGKRIYSHQIFCDKCDPAFTSSLDKDLPGFKHFSAPESPETRKNSISDELAIINKETEDRR